jgi:hypothetical protein
MEITLSNGRTVADKPMLNGAKEVYMVDGGVMSEPEWEEFVSRLRELVRGMRPCAGHRKVVREKKAARA